MGERVLILALAVLLLTGTGTQSASKRGLPEQIIPQCFGVNIHFTGDNDREVKQIAEAGFKFIRMDFSWSWIEKQKGSYDFSQYDGLMNALDRYGIRPLFILDYGNPLYDNDMAPCTDEGRKAFAAFARAAASHFKDMGILWEIWNEPNISGFWRPKPNAEHYVLLANLTAKAVKQGDPTATVLGPALAGTDPTYLEQIFKGGVLENIDAVSVHPYRGTHPETASSDYRVIRMLIDRYAPKGKHIPIVSGEWGYSAANMSVERQAQFLVRQFLSNMLCGVKLSIWYDWHNDGEDPKENEHNFGTVYWDFSPKPAYNAVKTLTKELAGCTLARRLFTSDRRDYILLFKNDRGHKLAAWTTGMEHEIDFPLDVPEVILVDIYGKRSNQKVTAGNLKLRLSQAVTYIEIPTKSKRLAVEEAWDVSPEPSKDANSSRLVMTCRLTNPLDYPIKVTGLSIEDSRMGAVASGSGIKELAPGKVFLEKPMYEAAWDGRSQLAASVALTIDGMGKPFRRKVEFDTTRRFTVTASPPSDDTVVLTVTNPSGEPFSGSVMLSGGPGITVSEISVPVKLAKGQSAAQISYPVITADKKQYSFSFKVLNGNDVVYQSEDRTYKAAELFEKTDGVSVIMDGNSEVSGSADISAVEPPEGLPGAKSCIKIDYKFGSGWKFARLAPKVELPVSGKPKEIGVWVYGDGSSNFVRARLTDSSGQTFQPHLATLDFKGWRFVTCPIDPARMGWWGGANDGVIHWPLKWDTLLLVDSNGGKEQSGTIYTGPVWVVY